jgi:hypothetical protein
MSSEDGTALSSKLQRELLLPFLTLRGQKQSCSVTGFVDATLSRATVATMSPTVRWTRAWHRELFDLATAIFNESVAAIDSGDWIQAKLTFQNFDYMNSILLGVWAGLNNNQGAAKDGIFTHHFGFPIRRTSLNYALVLLQLARTGSKDRKMALCDAVVHLAKTEVDDNGRDQSKAFYGGMLTREVAAVKQVYGVARFIRGEYAHASQHFRSAMECYGPSSRHFAAEFHDFMTTRRTEDARKHTIERFFKLSQPGPILRSPLLRGKYPPISELVVADEERNCLMQLGYTGDMLFDRISQKEGWSVANGRVVNVPFTPSTQLREELAPMVQNRAGCEGKEIRSIGVPVGWNGIKNEVSIKLDFASNLRRLMPGFTRAQFRNGDFKFEKGTNMIYPVDKRYEGFA